MEEAETGTRGLEIVRASRPEIVLVDLGLPGLDGYAVAEAVREGRHRDLRFDFEWRRQRRDASSTRSRIVG